MPIARVLRLGLRQFAGGMLSVLTLGILNRVMKVEMGLDLAPVALVIGAHYLAAAVAIPMGHRSDRHPLFRVHRTPYILGGAAITSAATVAAPFLALHVETHSGEILAWLAALAVFLILGMGTYTAGTAYLSLVSDLTEENERPRVISIIWSMMMLGILAGVGLGVRILDAYSPDRLIRLFTLAAVGVFGLTGVAVWGQERRTDKPPASTAVPLGKAVALVIQNRQARLFFAFLTSGILFLFLQQVVLEPFGGDVFGMDIRQTTMFNAYQMLGVLTGICAGGAWLGRRLGNRGTAALGLSLAAASFVLLTVSAGMSSPRLVTPAILLMGLGMGLFNVGGLALMMGMTAEAATGLYMGTWTLAQALANGLASIGGGAVFQAALGLFGEASAAYAFVFGLEVVGLCATVWLLRAISLPQFRQGVASASALSRANG